jgi:hypothetical protein
MTETATDSPEANRQGARPRATVRSAGRAASPKNVRLIPSRQETAVFVLHLQPTGGGDGILELRAALKVLLRRFGLRCVGLNREGDQ